ncbi:hypothetical protein LCGC14_2306670 [marine sediment metagenome]|uniref:Uncharacterized protein n=1 Tax=marine sediment metagenome TaxID=412755 RepID=A0A0F9EZA7_9ZZZZ
MNICLNRFRISWRIQDFHKDKTVYDGLLSNNPDYEYQKEAVEVMKGDFLLVDENKNILVIECKSLKLKNSDKRFRVH